VLVTYWTERFVPVAFWKLRPVNQPIQRSAAEPRDRALSTDGRKEPVEVPPANWIALVVDAPRFVTDWNVSDSRPVTCTPFTKSAVVETVFAPNQEVVAFCAKRFAEFRFETVPEEELKVLRFAEFA
jgi:hypothetical protein